ncbi:MAG: sigma-70 family RNA polymerase sigma factor [Bacteroidia bacterium]
MNNTQPFLYKTKEHSGKGDFIAKLYTGYGKKMFAYARHTWKLDEDTAWTIIYDTLYKVANTFERYSFETEEKFGSFIFRIFINLMRNHYRDTRKEREGMIMTSLDDESQTIQTTTAESEPVANFRISVLQKELEKLEDWQRILLLMRSDGRPYAEIAEFVKKPEDQLKVYYQRLKKQITEKLHEPS